jgi:inosine-uridine nucleoside N-ribohydrolase
MFRHYRLTSVLLALVCPPILFAGYHVTGAAGQSSLEVAPPPKARAVPIVRDASSSRASATPEGDHQQDRPAPRKILLDADPGGDDVIALLWLQSLAKQGLAEIVAVTTVDGNVRNQHTFANACKTLALGGFGHVEVGRALPGSEAASDAAYIHGSDGIGNLSRTLPASRHELGKARFGRDIIIEQLNAAPGEITLVAIGPLTNLAAAEAKSPGVLAKAKELVLMGGAFRCGGNITSQAEFNVHYDPEAASSVFAAREDTVALPLDVTQQITLTAQLANEISKTAPESPIARFVAALSQFMSKTSMAYRDTQGVRGFHVHDAATLAYLFYPETLLLRRAKVRVETTGDWTRGKTVFDDRHLPKTEANAWVAMEVDAVNLLAILSEDLRVLMQAK